MRYLYNSEVWQSGIFEDKSQINLCKMYNFMYNVLYAEDGSVSKHMSL